MERPVWFHESRSGVKIISVLKGTLKSANGLLDHQDVEETKVVNFPMILLSLMMFSILNVFHANTIGMREGLWSGTKSKAWSCTFA